MHPIDTFVRQSAYGLAFAIEDLVMLRSWAEERTLLLTIALDRTLDGAEFEELLVLAAPDAPQPTLTLWRTQDGIFAQTPTGRPQGFASLHQLLENIRPIRSRRAAWMQRLGLSA